jgi:hypothetical protein
LNRDPTSTIQKKNNDLVSSLKKVNAIDADTAKLLTIYNAVAPKFYGLPKIHKTDIPLRPIVSSINSPTYGLSKFVSNILNSALGNNFNYNTKDSFTFAEEFNNFQLPDGFVIISLDVVSLFTNIPLQLVIDIINSKWESIENHCSFNQDQFNQIINFIFNNSYFILNNCYYKQVFGTPMGSPLSPIIATIVMDELLDKVIPKLDFQLPFIKKYVDDICCAVPADKIEYTKEVFNSFNNHLQFTVEQETNFSVPFLDTKLIRTPENKIILDWYQKPTSSGRYINFQSNHPFGQKISIVLALKNRILKISHHTFIKKNLDKLYNILINNGFPKLLIKKLLFSTLNEANHVTAVEDNQITIYKKLPYINPLTNNLINILRNNNTKIAKCNPLTINSLYSKVKDKTPLLFNSNVVYSIPCLDCEKRYIGQTSQLLRSRLYGHKNDCKHDKISCALVDHSISMNHQFDFNNVKILDSERNYRKRLFLEMLHIKKEPLAVNYQTDVENLNNVYAYLININNFNESFHGTQRQD